MNASNDVTDIPTNDGYNHLKDVIHIKENSNNNHDWEKDILIHNHEIMETFSINDNIVRELPIEFIPDEIKAIKVSKNTLDPNSEIERMLGVGDSILVKSNPLVAVLDEVEKIPTPTHANQVKENNMLFQLEDSIMKLPNGIEKRRGKRSGERSMSTRKSRYVRKLTQQKRSQSVSTASAINRLDNVSSFSPRNTATFPIQQISYQNQSDTKSSGNSNRGNSYGPIIIDFAAVDAERERKKTLRKKNKQNRTQRNLQESSDHANRKREHEQKTSSKQSQIDAEKRRRLIRYIIYKKRLQKMKKNSENNQALESRAQPSNSQQVSSSQSNALQIRTENEQNIPQILQKSNEQASQLHSDEKCVHNEKLKPTHHQSKRKKRLHYKKLSGFNGPLIIGGQIIVPPTLEKNAVNIFSDHIEINTTPDTNSPPINTNDSKAEFIQIQANSQQNTSTNNPPTDSTLMNEDNVLAEGAPVSISKTKMENITISQDTAPNCTMHLENETHPNKVDSNIKKNIIQYESGENKPESKSTKDTSKEPTELISGKNPKENIQKEVEPTFFQNSDEVSNNKQTTQLFVQGDIEQDTKLNNLQLSNDAKDIYPKTPKVTTEMEINPLHTPAKSPYSTQSQSEAENTIEKEYHKDTWTPSGDTLIEKIAPTFKDSLQMAKNQIKSAVNDLLINLEKSQNCEFNDFKLQEIIEGCELTEFEGESEPQNEGLQFDTNATVEDYIVEAEKSNINSEMSETLPKVEYNENIETGIHDPMNQEPPFSPKSLGDSCEPNLPGSPVSTSTQSQNPIPILVPDESSCVQINHESLKAREFANADNMTREAVTPQKLGRTFDSSPTFGYSITNPRITVSNQDVDGRKKQNMENSLDWNLKNNEEISRKVKEEDNSINSKYDEITETTLNINDNIDTNYQNAASVTSNSNVIESSADMAKIITFSSPSSASSSNTNLMRNSISENLQLNNTSRIMETTLQKESEKQNSFLRTFSSDTLEIITPEIIDSNNYSDEMFDGGVSDFSDEDYQAAKDPADSSIILPSNNSNSVPDHVKKSNIIESDSDNDWDDDSESQSERASTTKSMQLIKKVLQEDSTDGDDWDNATSEEESEESKETKHASMKENTSGTLAFAQRVQIGNENPQNISDASWDDNDTGKLPISTQPLQVINSNNRLSFNLLDRKPKNEKLFFSWSSFQAKIAAEFDKKLSLTEVNYYYKKHKVEGIPFTEIVELINTKLNSQSKVNNPKRAISLPSTSQKKSGFTESYADLYKEYQSNYIPKVVLSQQKIASHENYANVMKIDAQEETIHAKLKKYFRDVSTAHQLETSHEKKSKSPCLVLRNNTIKDHADFKTFLQLLSVSEEDIQRLFTSTIIEFHPLKQILRINFNSEEHSRSFYKKLSSQLHPLSLYFDIDNVHKIKSSDLTSYNMKTLALIEKEIDVMFPYLRSTYLPKQSFQKRNQLLQFARRLKHFEEITGRELPEVTKFRRDNLVSLIQETTNRFISEVDMIAIRQAVASFLNSLKE